MNIGMFVMLSRKNYLTDRTMKLYTYILEVT